MDRKQRIIRNKKKHKSVLMFATVIALIGIAMIVYFVFKATDIQYVGSRHYTDEQLNQLIFDGKSVNTVKYKLLDDKNKKIPFIQKYDVDIQWPNKMKITIYEKPIIGAINYMGCYMYFDKDGMVVESSSDIYEHVPVILGLKFSQIVLNAKLDVGNDDIYDSILYMTQAFDKYTLPVDKVYFDNEYNVTLYLDKIKVILGKNGDFTDKLYELSCVFPEIQNYSGTLYLDNFNGDTSSVIFKKDNDTNIRN